MIIENRLLKILYFINIVFFIAIIIFEIIINTVDLTKFRVNMNTIICFYQNIDKLLINLIIILIINFFIINIFYMLKYVLIDKTILNKIYCFNAILIIIPIIFLFFIQHLSKIVYIHPRIDDIFFLTYDLITTIGWIICSVFLLLNIIILIQYRNIISLIYCIFILGIIIGSFVLKSMRFYYY